MSSTEVEVFLPRVIELDDGRIITLSEEEVARPPPNHVLELWVPPDYIDKIRKHLVESEGFSETSITSSIGEKYSLTRKIQEPWEVHIRLFDDGRIVGEIEVSRDYLEHLTPHRLPLIYDVYALYRPVYRHMHLMYRPEKRWVRKILSNYKFLLRPPSSLTPWLPIVVGIAALGLGVLIGWMLRELTEPQKK